MTPRTSKFFTTMLAWFGWRI